MVGTDADEIALRAGPQWRIPPREHVALQWCQEGRTPSPTLNPHQPCTEFVLAAGTMEPEHRRSRGIARWKADGTRALCHRNGSNNVVTIDSVVRAQVWKASSMWVKEPPRSVLDETRSRAYVLNKFEGSISTVWTSAAMRITYPTISIPHRG